MNYREAISHCIDFIETHIKEELTAEKVSRHVGYSAFHLSRVFTFCQGVSLMDYVRKRRLSLARSELLCDRKIIDIALDYGFKTSSGFSKAFRKEFGYSPTIYIAKMVDCYEGEIITNIGGYIMNPVIMKKPAFKVAGYGIKTNIRNGYMKDIAAYWDSYTGENLESKMYKQLNPPKHGEVGVCIPSSDNGDVTYLLGVIVDDFSKVTPDMITVEIPEAEYAIFTTPPIDLTKAGQYTNNSLSDIVKSTWKYIFEEWFADSEFVYDESKIDFEFYDERCHYRPDTTMDIYVPVIKKS
ncbi:MAG: AraC family transcriptional regulator [Firmicutes bacterium]|nr:AraC family transcriptional regulator [Bacillota bacterium]